MRKKPILVLDIHRVCNQKCAYCVANASSRDFGPIVTQEAIENLSWLYKSFESLNVLFTGGEPLITPKIEEIFENVINHGHTISIQSNLKINAKRVLSKFSPDKFEWILSTFHSVEIERFNRYLKIVSDIRKDGYPVVVKLVLDDHMLVHFESIYDELRGNGVPVILSPLVLFPQDAPPHPRMYSSAQWSKIAPRMTLLSSWLYFAGGLHSRGKQCLAGSKLFYASFPRGGVQGCSHGYPASMGNVFEHTLHKSPGQVVCEMDFCLCDFHYYSGIIVNADDSAGFNSLLLNPRQTVTFKEYEEWISKNKLTTYADLRPYQSANPIDISAHTPPLACAMEEALLGKYEDCSRNNGCAGTRSSGVTSFKEEGRNNSSCGSATDLFCVTGTGRCGTMMFSNLLSSAGSSHCVHEKHFRHSSMVECFQNGDMNGFKKDIFESLIPTLDTYIQGGVSYGVSSGHMYLSIPMLYDIFKTRVKFIGVIRKPEDFVSSALARGFFDPSHQKYCNQISPSATDSFSLEWNRMSPFEKCLWYWNMVNSYLFVQQKKHKDNIMLVRLESLNQDLVYKIYDFLNLAPQSEDVIQSVLADHSNASPGAGHNCVNPNSVKKKLGPVETWTDEEQQLLEKYTGELRRLIYEEKKEVPCRSRIEEFYSAPSVILSQIPCIPVEQLHNELGFPPSHSPLSSPGTPLDRWRMEINDAPIFRYLYRSFRPKRHLEFGTWQGAGVVYCLEECDATVWTLNMPFGENKSDGGAAYSGAGESYGLGATLAKEWAQRLGLPPQDAYRTDSFGFIGRFYLEKQLGNRVCQIYCNSTQWDIANYPEGFFDSVLIDGGHEAHVVLSDTRKALSLLRPGGLIMWHDFCPPVRGKFEVVQGVMSGIEQASELLSASLEKLFWVDPSWILVGIKKS